MRRVVIILVCLVFVLLPAAGQGKKKPASKTEPHVIFTIPLGVSLGKATRVTIRGSNLDDTKDVKLQGIQGSVKILSKGKAGVPDKNAEKVGDTQIVIELKLDGKPGGELVAIVVVTPAGETKPHALLVETTRHVIAEKEGNDSFRTAQPITVPVVIEGAINRAKDVDLFRFDGKKGQKMLAEVLASRHGSPVDAILTLYDAKGQQLATNDDFAKDHRDARIEWRLPADGVYYLSLIDAHDTGSNLHVYRLVVE